MNFVLKGNVDTLIKYCLRGTDFAEKNVFKDQPARIKFSEEEA